MPSLFGFELVKDQHIHELNTRVRYFRHIKTGAELFSLENDDENKVFSINFRTPVSDSTGIAHIMEHAVLCGSRKYPVKEPFVELLKGSLKTFVNAFTYPDKTCYPVASQNAKDFYNLIYVYLDAVFYPLIPLHTLQQEGWHYELDNADDPLVYKGVVFNEMKGSFSSPDNLLGLKSQQSLFPDTSYAFVSGGDPEKIPDLTYQQFKDFHTHYYHPSNSRIFFYGDDDPDTRLKILDEYLRDFEKISVDSQVKLQPSLKESRRVILPYDAGTEVGNDLSGGNGGKLNKKAWISVNWLLPETGDVELSLGLNILEHILVETPASPLRKALIDSGLGDDLTQSGVADYLRQIFFTAGMKGISLDDTDKVEALICEVLERLVTDGIDSDMVAASLNTIEFRLRENNTGSFPRGISLMLRSLTSWLHDMDPIAPLAFEAPLKHIKQRIESGDRYFEGLIRDLILANPHRATVILKPDPEYGKNREAEERARLDKARAAMSEADLQAIAENTRQLKLLQETPDSPEALATIPILKIADLDRRNKLIPLDVENL